jgi:hypothetical protein
MTHGGTGAGPGNRCTERATEPNGAPQLCWVHARALANRNRLVPLQLVPMTLAERGELAEHAEALRDAAAAALR